jgi:hypothetical protein
MLDSEHQIDDEVCMYVLGGDGRILLFSRTMINIVLCKHRWCVQYPTFLALIDIVAMQAI